MGPESERSMMLTLEAVSNSWFRYGNNAECGPQAKKNNHMPRRARRKDQTEK